MGAFYVTRLTVAEQLTELVGFRAGLAVTEVDILRTLQRYGYRHLYPLHGDGAVRMRSEAYEIMSRCVTDSFIQPGALRAMRSLPARVQDRLADQELTWQALGFVDAMSRNSHGQTSPETPVSPELSLRVGAVCPQLPDDRAQVRQTALRLHGPDLARAVDIVCDEIEFQESANPWTHRVRTVEWNDVLALADLFSSDSTTASCGRFFDQRHINYLVSNYEDLGSIHWRKFEALVAERFYRMGFEVELGPGRNDNGVDLRLWEPGAAVGGQTPPTVIVQCKRERRKISKVVVKALCADVTWENARTGLLVTTSEWSPGARQVARTRNYPVQEVNGQALRQWLTAMQHCDTGLWMPGSSS